MDCFDRFLEEKECTPCRSAGDGPDVASRLRAVALDLITESSCGQATIKDIARDADMTPALIYYYYDDKEGPCRAAIEDASDRIFATFRGVIDESQDPWTLIEIWLETHIREMELVRKMVKASMDLRTVSTQGVEVDEAVGHFYELERATLSRLIDRGTRLGPFRSVEADEVRRVVSTFLDGAMVRSIIRKDFDLRRTIETFRDVLWCYLAPDSKERPVSRS